jgi:hypothetical protein
MISSQLRRSALLAALSVGLAAVASAAPIQLFNTGVDALGNPLSGGSADSHYSVAGVGPAQVLSDANVWYQWQQPGDAKWIAPFDLWQVPPAWYSFETTFDLTGLDPNTAQISGAWAADQFGSMYLNNMLVSSIGDGNWAGPLTTFSINQYFVQGVNTLRFDVLFPDGGDGLIVSNLVGEADPVPEPATVGLLAAGLLGLARRRR